MIYFKLLGFGRMWIEKLAVMKWMKASVPLKHSVMFDFLSSIAKNNHYLTWTHWETLIYQYVLLTSVCTNFTQLIQLWSQLFKEYNLCTVLDYSDNCVVSLFIKMPKEDLHIVYKLKKLASILYESMHGYLFLDIIYYEKLEGTDNVQEQISVHIIAPNGLEAILCLLSFK